MSTEQSTVERREGQYGIDSGLRNGSVLMALAGIAFVGYGVVFLALAFFGDGFELGVSVLDGLSRAEMAAANPETAYYITHLHVATAAFIISTGLAVAAMSWYGVRSGQRWALVTSVVAAVIGVALAIPMHWTEEAFAHNWLSHLGPIYLAVIVFVVGAILAFRSMRSASADAEGG